MALLSPIFITIVMECDGGAARCQAPYCATKRGRPKKRGR
jgi:hypothetical protein